MFNFHCAYESVDYCHIVDLSKNTCVNNFMNKLCYIFFFVASVFVYKFDKLDLTLKFSVEMKFCLDRFECQLRFKHLSAKHVCVHSVSVFTGNGEKSYFDCLHLAQCVF